mgnify:CR=1 FL=1
MGCDLFVSPTGFYKKSFNPRTHVGCDREWLFDFAIPEVFQSTHPRGVRQISVNTINQRGRFNPRTHVGCDTTIAIIRAIIAGFNPRTHVGCDIDVIVTVIQCGFQSTHPRGVRRVSPFPGMFVPVCFNPRTHVGCDMRVDSDRNMMWVSIHAPTWGATPPSFNNLTFETVSIHAPTWGATFRLFCPD